MAAPKSSGLCIAFPVVRLAQVCVTDRPLDLAESSVVAEQIRQDWDAFREGSELGWSKCAKDYRVSWAPGEETRIDHSEITPVVQFPKLEVSTEDWVFSSRMDLTVCARGNNSKVWCRIVLKKVREQDAEDLTLQEVSEFFEHATAACRNVTNQLAVHYKQILLVNHYAQKFDSAFDVLIKAVNSPSPRLAEIFKQIRLGQISNMASVLAHPDYVETLAPFLKLARLTLADAQRIAQAKAPKRNWELHLTDEFAAIYYSRVTQSAIEYVGLAYEEPMPVRPSTAPASVGSTRALALDLAPIF